MGAHHAHGHACACAAHAPRPRPRSAIGATLLPILACAVCPACLATYAKLFSVLGVGVALGETSHRLVLGAAITASLALSAQRSRRSRRVWPLGVALAGALLVGLGHAVETMHALEWAGALVLLAGGLFEHVRLRRAAMVRP